MHRVLINIYNIVVHLILLFEMLLVQWCVLPITANPFIQLNLLFGYLNCHHCQISNSRQTIATMKFFNKSDSIGRRANADAAQLFPQQFYQFSFVVLHIHIYYIYRHWIFERIHFINFLLLIIIYKMCCIKTECGIKEEGKK